VNKKGKEEAKQSTAKRNNHRERRAKRDKLKLKRVKG
jgi:hypothetical protein